MERTVSPSAARRRSPGLLVLPAASLAGLLLAPGPAQAQASLADAVSGCGGVAPQTTIPVDPSSYLAALGNLAPGERLLLAAGTYTQGLPVTDVHGEPDRCVVIEGPDAGPAAVFTGRDCCNTVSIRDSSYVIIRNLELDGSGRFGDAVKAESDSTSSHHLVLENLYIHDHDVDQQVVGINTKSVAWNWVIRDNVIAGAGTGIYLGDSNGADEFVGGLIEHNLIHGTLGYNLQIKHQLGRATGLGVPASATTIIRHNVLSKAQGSAAGVDARPNLLVGHWPLSGAGGADVYQIYGNLFYQNPVEALFQGEGNVAFHDNLLVNDVDSGFAAVAIQPHNDLPKEIEVYHNTVVVAGAGIFVTGGDAGFQQRVRANAVFSPIAVTAEAATDNVVDTYANAAAYVADPFSPLGAGLDLYPLAGALNGAVVDLSDVAGFVDSHRDFDGTLRDGSFRGAYAGEGTNPGWSLALERKPDVGTLRADLAIAKTNHQLVTVPGSTTTFDIDVTNGGPEDVTAARVTDDFDPSVFDVAGVSWTCAPGAGSGPGTSCPSSGTGVEIASGVDVNLESGGLVSFSVQAPVLASATGRLSNTATVEPPAGVLDAELGDNAATDTDGVPGDCGFADDLDLANMLVDSVETFTACRSIVAGGPLDVESPGELTLRAGSSVVLRSGFSVRDGGSFRAEIDGSLAPP